MSIPFRTCWRLLVDYVRPNGRAMAVNQYLRTLSGEHPTVAVSIAHRQCRNDTIALSGKLSSIAHRVPRVNGLDMDNSGFKAHNWL